MKRDGESYNKADSNCEFSELCLNCSLEMCVFDEEEGKWGLLRKLRAEEIKRFIDEGKEVKEIAAILELSVRTVQRVLKGEL